MPKGKGTYQKKVGHQKNKGCLLGSSSLPHARTDTSE